MRAPAGEGIDPGWSLTLACARHAAGIVPSTEVVAAADRVRDWPAALRIAREQGLGALLVRALGDGGADASIEQRAREAVAVSTARTLGQLRLLARVEAALAAAGITAIPYKGPALSLQLYGDATLRSSVDLDVVVPRDAYERARVALVAIGLPPRGGHSLRQEHTLFRWLGHASFGGGGEEIVELHWRFAPLQFPFALTPERALERSSRVRIAGRSMPAMAAADLVTTLAMHAARHLFERLEWLAGVARLLLERPDDAVPILAHAERLRARRTLLVSAGVAMRVLDAPLGPSWRRALDADGEAGLLAAEMSALVERGWRGGATPVEGATLQRLLARLLDTRGDRVRALLRSALLPTEREWEAVALPDALTPLYHLVRPVRLAARFARRTVRGSQR